MRIGPHHPDCLHQPVTFLGDGCICKAIVIPLPAEPIWDHFTYSGYVERHGMASRWYSQYPVRLTRPRFVGYQPRYRRLGYPA